MKREGLKIKSKIAVIDFETTGFNPYEDEVTEVGLVIIDGMTGEDIGVFNHLVKIKADEVPDRVTELTGITKEATEEYGLELSAIKPYLQSALEDCIVVAHNYAFEAFWLDVVFGIKPKLFYDTLAIDRIARPHESSHKLSDICEREGIDLTNAHRAIHDAKATLELVVKQLNWSDDNRKEFLNTITTRKGQEDYLPNNVMRMEPL